MKTGRFYLAIIFLGAFTAIGFAQSTHGYETTLAETMEELSRCPKVYAGDRVEGSIYVKQICPFLTDQGAVGEYQRTVYIDYELHTMRITDTWLELLD